MERITKRDKTGYPTTIDRYASPGIVIAKLADYEDSGLTPEEVIELIKANIQKED